jgi:hypothetical protein
MKKAGEKAKSFVLHALFIMVVLGGLYFIVTTSVSITGHAVLDAATAKTKLESALSSSALFNQVMQGSVCVVINDPEQPLSLQAVKSSTGWTVSEMVGLCSGESNEDIIVQFADYDSFSAVVDNPSPRNIANAVINRDFEVVPSKYVELGGNVICDATFRVKYCNAISTMAEPDQLIDGDLTCCLDELTRAQKKLLEEHLEQGNFEDEIGVLEKAGGVAGMSMATSIIILVVIVLVIGGAAAGVFMMKGKGKPKAGAKPSIPGAKPETPGAPGMPGAPATPGVAAAGALAGAAAASPTEDPQITELRDYVTGVIVEGYTTDEIRTHLLEIGWDSDTSDKILQEAYEKARAQQGQQ